MANDPGGKKREEVFVDIIEKISVTFNASVSNILVVEIYLEALHVPCLMCLELKLKKFGIACFSVAGLYTNIGD